MLHLNTLSFAAAPARSKPIASNGSNYTTKLKDFKTGESRAVLGNVTNTQIGQTTTTTTKEPLSKKTKAPTNSLAIKPAKLQKPSEKVNNENAPRRKARLSLTSRRKSRRESISVTESMDIELNDTEEMLDNNNNINTTTSPVPLAPTPLHPQEKETLRLPPGAVDIDENDANDPQWVTPYIHQIVSYLKENEVRTTSFFPIDRFTHTTHAQRSDRRIH